MADFYEVDILCTGSDSENGRFDVINRERKEFDSAKDIIAWLKDKYGSLNVKRGVIYDGTRDDPCGYTYLFENADLSHVPVERWIQRDWVNIYKVHTESCFKEIKHELSES